MATPPNKVIIFPPLSLEDAAKVDNLLETMGEFMEVKIIKTEVRVLRVEFDAERDDVAAVLNKIAGAKKKPRKAN